MPHKNHLFRRRIVWTLAAALASWLAFTAFRSKLLLNQARLLAARAEGFPRDYMVGEPGRPVRTCVVLGDSTAAGWGATRVEDTLAYRVASALANDQPLHVVNLAVGGAKLRDVLDTQIPQLKSQHPELILISIGANDATGFTPTVDFERQLRQFLTALQASGAHRILLANTPDMVRVPALPWPVAIVVGGRTRQQNTVLERVVGGTNVQIVDLFERGKLDYAAHPELYAPDRFHPSGKGYAVWARVFEGSDK